MYSGYRRKFAAAAAVSLITVVCKKELLKRSAICEADSNVKSIPMSPTQESSSKISPAVKKSNNPFDCKNPACNSKMDMLQNAMKHRNLKNKHEVISSPVVVTDPEPSSNKDEKEGLTISNNNANLVADTETDESVVPPYVSNCPLDREELGRATWGLIHTVAAYYPDIPNETDKENAKNFIVSLSYLYPCEICRDDFKESVLSSPPK
jgi:hypothetical protein